MPKVSEQDALAAILENVLDAALNREPGDGGAHHEDAQGEIDRLLEVAEDPGRLAELVRDLNAGGPAPASLSLTPGVAVSEEVRARVRRAVAKRYPGR